MSVEPQSTISSMLVSVEGKVKMKWSQMTGTLQCCHIDLCSEIIDNNRPVCFSIVVMEKPTVGSPAFGAFAYDRIPKAVKNVSAHFFIHTFYNFSHSAISVNSTSDFS